MMTGERYVRQLHMPYRSLTTVNSSTCPPAKQSELNSTINAKYRCYRTNPVRTTYSHDVTLPFKFLTLDLRCISTCVASHFAHCHSG